MDACLRARRRCKLFGCITFCCAAGKDGLTTSPYQGVLGVGDYRAMTGLHMLRCRTSFGAVVGATAGTMLMADLASADAVSEFMAGKRIAFDVSCQRAGIGRTHLSLNKKNNLILLLPEATKPLEFVDGVQRDDYFHRTAKIEGDELIITMDALKLSGVRFTDAIRVRNGTCEVRHAVEPGNWAESLDPGCKAVRCPSPSHPEPGWVAASLHHVLLACSPSICPILFWWHSSAIEHDPRHSRSRLK